MPLYKLRQIGLNGLQRFYEPRLINQRFIWLVETIDSTLYNRGPMGQQMKPLRGKI